MLTIFALQIIVPRGLILWLALTPATNRLALVTQVATTAIALFTTGLAGIWLFPSWWAPWLYAVLF